MNGIAPSLARKADTLRERITGLRSLAVAFSGGLDSRFLLHAALAAGAKVTALHIAGPHVPPAERAEAEAWAGTRGVPLTVVSLDVLAVPEVAENGPERCYYCKRALFAALREAAGALPLCDGTNASDLFAYRPGLRALKELGILSPLAEAGITKEEIRLLAASAGMDRPDQAARPCLLTRFAYGARPTREKLADLAKAEQAVAEILVRHAAPGAVNFRLRLGLEGKAALHLELPSLPAPLREELARALAARAFPGAAIECLETVSGYFDRRE